jgi:hypothetical protein
MWDKAIEAILASSSDSSIYIGCDSVCFKDRKGKWQARYATVVIVHHSTRHGASIYHHVETLPDYSRSIKQRMMQEVYFATAAALEIVDWLEGRSMEIHLDINPNPKHKSNVAMREAIGYVLGNTGLQPMLKPDAWAASHASDHCARQKDRFTPA